MVEDPNYEYKYDLAVWKSFSARLSLTILGIAAGVFMVAMLMYLYFQEGIDGRKGMLEVMCSGESGMLEIFKRHDPSLLIYEPVSIDGLTAAVVCSRLDIISSYKTADLLWSSCLHPRSVGPDLDLCLCHSQDGKAAASVYRVGYEHCRR